MQLKLCGMFLYLGMRQKDGKSQGRVGREEGHHK